MYGGFFFQILYSAFLDGMLTKLNEKVNNMECLTFFFFFSPTLFSQRQSKQSKTEINAIPDII